jgi:hypothetical protein
MKKLETLTMFGKGGKKALVNWSQVTTVVEVESMQGEDFRDVFFVGGHAISVEETLSEIQPMLESGRVSLRA